MKTIVLALSAAVIATAVATSAAAERFAQRPPSYEQRFQLGLARGFIVSVGDWRNLEKFIKECMAGNIPS